MWISKNITSHGGTGAASAGAVGHSANLRVSAASAGGIEKCAMMTPPGIYSLPTNSQPSVVLQTQNGPVCIGMRMNSYPGEIEPGEIILESMGGAQIKLSNDGVVYINGKEFNWDGYGN